MSENDELRQKLLDTIKDRRAALNTYIKEQQRRGNRLTNVGITCTAVTAALTAGPGVGRDKFVQAMQAIFHTQDAAIWGTLCLLAMLLSIVAAVVSNINKPQDTTDRLVKAQTSSVLLEKLAASLQFEQMPVADASKLFQQYVADVPFVE